MGGYCLVTRTSFESIFITELSSIDLLGFSFHFNKYDELISAIGTPVRQILAAASRLYSWRLECFATGSPPTPAPALLASTRVAASPKTRSQVAGRTARNPFVGGCPRPRPQPSEATSRQSGQQDQSTSRCCGRWVRNANAHSARRCAGSPLCVCSSRQWTH